MGREELSEENQKCLDLCMSHLDNKNKDIVRMALKTLHLLADFKPNRKEKEAIVGPGSMTAENEPIEPFG